MKLRRLDLYAECNVEPRALLDVFTAECCSRCVNPECIRSNFGNSKFDARVANWHERLFTGVPRMAADDERFAQIAGQRFLLIDPGGHTSTPSQGWVDPRDLKAASVQVPAQIEAPKKQKASKRKPPKKQPMEEVVERATPAHPEKRPPARGDLAFVNTPVTQGQMIGGRAAPTAAEWRTSVPKAPEEHKVVTAGAKIKLGS